MFSAQKLMGNKSGPSTVFAPKGRKDWAYFSKAVRLGNVMTKWSIQTGSSYRFVSKFQLVKNSGVVNSGWSSSKPFVSMKGESKWHSKLRSTSGVFSFNFFMCLTRC